MKRMLFISVALAVALGTVLVGGCGEKAEEAGSGTAEGRTLIMFVCNANDEGISDPVSTTKVGDVEQNRGQVIKYTQDASDDRLDGTGELTVNNDIRDDGSSTGWGTMQITNDGGTWQGSWNAASGAKLNGDIYFATNLTGTGDYEGLICRALGIQGAVTLGLDDNSAYTGWIEQVK